MNEDTRQKRWWDRLPLPFPRLVLLAALTAVIVSLGMAVTPLRPAISPEQAFSGEARASALAEALRLRDAGTHLVQQLGEPDSGAATSALGLESAGTVTLLTTHGRALLTPAGGTPGPSPSVAGTPPAGAAAPSPAPPATELAAKLATDLAASGSRRLADAAGTDGGTARLLASIGAAQLIRSAALAAAAGAPAPAGPDLGAAPDLAGLPQARECESPAATAAPLPAAGAGANGTGDGDAGGAAATLEAALAAATAAEHRAIYGYQVALPRLSAGAAAAAAVHLASHHGLVTAAAAMSRTNCAPEPLPAPGYALEGSFLASPPAGLAALEAGTLPAFADLVALSDGATRSWAIGALLGAAQRAAGWGADPGALPGLPGIEAQLPPLPEPARSPGA